MDRVGCTGLASLRVFPIFLGKFPTPGILEDGKVLYTLGCSSLLFGDNLLGKESRAFFLVVDNRSVFIVVVRCTL